MTRQRPLSAIFIGSSSSSSSLQLQLQHPPPSPSSNTSGGLPSPPATNSTGSGSTKEDNSTGSIRQCPAPNITMVNHHNDKSTLSDDDNDENDDDNTARLDRRHPSKNTGEVLGTLQRVKSLAQRNRMAIDKLTSFSRLNTPSPSSSSRMSRSPGSNLLASASTSSLTSTSHHSHPASSSTSNRRHADTLSGSETERESFRAPTPSHSNSFRSASPDLSTSPPLPPLPPSTLPSYDDDANHPRQRRISAPPSPDKARQASPGPSRTPRKRTSLASTMSAPVGPLDADRERDRYHAHGNGHAHERSYANRDNVTDTALAAVASARQSPTDTATTSTSSRRSRQPLPREFRNGGRTSLDGRTSIEPPQTPYRTPIRNGAHGHNENADMDLSPRTASHTAANAGMARLQFSPRSAARLNRSSTVRDDGRRYQPRCQSDDFLTHGIDDTPSIPSTFTSTATAAAATGVPVGGAGRRQTPRGGSAESPLTSGRLASESLRAAGIGMRSVRSPFLAGSTSSTANGFSVNNKDDDPFSGTGAGVSYRSKSRTGKSVEWEDRDYDRYGDRYGHDRDTRRHMIPDDQRSKTSASSSARVSDGVGPPGPSSSSRLGMGSSRPATSMATTGEWNKGLREGMDSRSGITESESRGEFERSRSVTLRRHTSAMAPSHSHTHSSPYPRHDQHQRGTSQQQAEHARLLAESLSMFHSTLSKLPLQASVARELGYQAETIVRASEGLNGLLRAGTAHAVQRQIAIEVDEDEDHDFRGDDREHVRDRSREGGRESGMHVAKLWRDVGADFREGLRESDEVVRTLTGFILGVGKVLKEMANIASASTSGGGGSAASTTSGTGSACGSATGMGEGKEHLRSVSLDHHDIMRHVRTPDSGGGLRDGRRSVESRKSWDPIGVGGAGSSSLDLSRRVTSVHRDREYELASSRPSSSALRERERDGGGSDQDRRAGSRIRMTPPLPLPAPPSVPASALSSALGSTSTSGLGPASTTRRLMTLRESREREQQLVSFARTPGTVDLSAPMDYEPSPTPASKQQYGKGMPPPLLSHSTPGPPPVKSQSTPGPSQLNSGGRPPSHAIVAQSTPPPLPILPSESFLRKSSLAEKQNRRKVSLASIASIMTIRPSGSGSGGSGGSQAPPFAVTSSAPTTAVTAHTVSASSPESLTPSSTLPPPTAAPLSRTDSRDSRESTRPSVTFSRPSEVSMSALQMQQSRDEARRRAEEELIREREIERESRQPLRSPLSGSETERDTRRRTIGSRVARMSLDAAIDEREGESMGRSGGVGAGSTRTSTITLPSQRRERRRTVTEIFG